MFYCEFIKSEVIKQTVNVISDAKTSCICEHLSLFQVFPNISMLYICESFVILFHLPQNHHPWCSCNKKIIPEMPDPNHRTSWASTSPLWWWYLLGDPRLCKASRFALRWRWRDPLWGNLDVEKLCAEWNLSCLLIIRFSTVNFQMLFWVSLQLFLELMHQLVWMFHVKAWENCLAPSSRVLEAGVFFHLIRVLSCEPISQQRIVFFQ